MLERSYAKRSISSTLSILSNHHYLGREWRKREKAEGGTNQVSFGCLVG